ncbi:MULTISPECIES: head-tail connector protein [unclassified Staphylococcus]|uniref:head-tail connector protein n=1 Tax=Mammaliicoccus sciuri TaxID=1296 RepID=UPI001951C9CC
MELENLKLHMHITHSMEDQLILEYKEWAEAEIKDSVCTDVDRNEDFFVDNKVFERAVVLLTSFYYHSRLAYDNEQFYAMPDGVLGAIQKLRGSYHGENEQNA